MNKILVGIILIGIVVLGGFVLSDNTQPPPQPSAEPTPTTTANGNMRIQTFVLDEENQPLDESTIGEAVARNEARIESASEQIDEDIQYLDELGDAMSLSEESGISQ